MRRQAQKAEEIHPKSHSEEMEQLGLAHLHPQLTASNQKCILFPSAYPLLFPCTLLLACHLLPLPHTD